MGGMNGNIIIDDYTKLWERIFFPYFKVTNINNIKTKNQMSGTPISLVIGQYQSIICEPVIRIL